MLEWIRGHAGLLAAISVGIGIVSAAAAMMILIQLPEDHFLGPEQTGRAIPARPNVVLAIFKNILGVVMIVLGAIMALPLIPGPGLVIMMIGLSLTNFPGKRRLELKILRLPLILNGVNRLRARKGRPPFRLPALIHSAEQR